MRPSLAMCGVWANLIASAVWRACTAGKPAVTASATTQRKRTTSEIAFPETGINDLRGRFKVLYIRTPVEGVILPREPRIDKQAGRAPAGRRDLLQVLADELRHLEHVHARLAAEDRLQRRVGVDHAAVL